MEAIVAPAFTIKKARPCSVNGCAVYITYHHGMEIHRELRYFMIDVAEWLLQGVAFSFFFEWFVSTTLCFMADGVKKYSIRNSLGTKYVFRDNIFFFYICVSG